MKTKEEIFSKYELKDEDGEGTDCLWYGDALLAMEEYAKLYHEEQVKKLNIPAAVGQSEQLPCKHLNTEKWGNGIKCTDCGKSF